ncbi:MAG TPA: hypothetical protein VF844_08290, partial [Ktedonobacteraceae bacterium]
IVMQIEELCIAIETYPQSLAAAMEEVAKAEQAIEKLEEQIEEEEANLSPEPEEASSLEDEDKQSDANIRELVLKLDDELSLLELRYEQIKGEIELEYRRNPPPGGKVIEAMVTAFVKSNARLVEAKKRCLVGQMPSPVALGCPLVVAHRTDASRYVVLLTVHQQSQPVLQ